METTYSKCISQNSLECEALGHSSTFRTSSTSWSTELCVPASLHRVVLLTCDTEISLLDVSQMFPDFRQYSTVYLTRSHVSGWKAVKLGHWRCCFHTECLRESPNPEISTGHFICVTLSRVYGLLDISICYSVHIMCYISLAGFLNPAKYTHSCWWTEWPDFQYLQRHLCRWSTVHQASISLLLQPVMESILALDVLSRGNDSGMVWWFNLPCLLLSLSISICARI